jgi:Zn-dependent protease with chaperone function
MAAWSTFLFVVLGAVMGTSSMLLGQIVWSVSILAGFTIRRRRQQKHEGQCDVRAAELCGDPEALIRALTKLHALGRVPEKWDREAGYSHPSLVRRIQTIREAAVTADISRTSRDSADSDRVRSSVS